MSRECRTTKTDYTIGLDSVKNEISVFRNLGNQSIAQVNTFGPFISLNGNFYVHDIVACKIFSRSNALYGSAGR